MWGHSALSAFVAIVLFWEKVTYEKTKSLSSKDLAACYDFLCQTMRNNDDAHFYTQVGIDLGTQRIWVNHVVEPKAKMRHMRHTAVLLLDADLLSLS